MIIYVYVYLNSINIRVIKDVGFFWWSRRECIWCNEFVL